MFDKESNRDETICFTKMHGIGNDYVYIDCLASTPERLDELARVMSDRHTGVGGDGIILILPSAVADFKMRIFNADGSEARMCGNGSRCVAKFVADKGLTDSDEITLETLGGVKHIRLLRDSLTDEVTGAAVDMGEPAFSCREIGMTVTSPDFIESSLSDDTTSHKLTAVGIGNPHGVVFLNDREFESLDIAEIGPRLENHSIWTDRANIEFARVNPDGSIDMRVWERGSGETMACGTGACATAVAAALTGRTSRKTTIHLRGGDLLIEWLPETNRVIMTGPATTVFEGTYLRPQAAIQKVSLP